MLWILIGAVSTVLCIYSIAARSSHEGSHRSQWSGKSNDGIPTVWHAIWFFLSIVAILAGYVQIATA